MWITALFLFSFGLCEGESENEALDYTQLTVYKIQDYKELWIFIIYHHLSSLSLLHSPEEEQHYRLLIIDSGGPVVQKEEISHQDTGSKNISFEYKIYSFVGWLGVVMHTCGKSGSSSL